jgi:hypothetical protein
MLPIISDDPLFHTLTPRQQAFVVHPEILTDPIKAAVDVGYSETTAVARAHVMRKQLMYYIRPLEQQRIAALGITIDRVRSELAATAFANVVDYYDTVDSPDGDTRRVFRAPEFLPAHLQAAIKQVVYDDMVHADGTVTQYIKSIVLYDKAGALRELAEIMGLKDAALRQPDGATRDADAQLLENLDDKELEVVQRLYQRAADRAKAVNDTKRDKNAIPGQKATR